MTDSNRPDPSTKDYIVRGFLFRCPQCGKGKLLRGFTTPNKCCSQCGLDFEPLRADDGPAWATILLTGHLVMPFAFWILEHRTLSTTTQIGILIVAVLLLSAMILPRAKGVFMAIIWVIHVRKT